MNRALSDSHPFSRTASCLYRLVTQKCLCWFSESQLKDNPAFSMLNDSDDEVIYGSDYEEMPLQNGQAIRAQYKEGSESD